MRFSVGYQITDPYDFSDCIKRYAEHIAEVYFPWLGIQDGRGLSVAGTDDQAFMEEELSRIHDLGIRLNVLFNANCYGASAISKRLKSSVCSIIEYLSGSIGLEAVTTTSLFIAEVVREKYPDIDVRASVNMEIGTIRGMKYVEEYFTSFYVAREFNRSPRHIARLRTWCSDREKKLYLLANSGCLRNCSAHTFHDNLVSHEKEIGCEENEWTGFPGQCWRFLSRPENKDSFIRDSTWLRPEDIPRYEGLVDGIKLATRSIRNPMSVIGAYTGGSFGGNMLSLCEPDFSGLCEIDGSAFSADWLDAFDEES